MGRLTGLTFTFLFILSGLVYAADAAAPPAASATQTKIGVVDMQTIAMECDAAKAFKEELENKYGKEKTNLEKQGQAVRKQAEGLKNPKAKDREAKQTAFLKAKQKLDVDTRNFVRKVEQEETKFRQELVTSVFSATYEVAKAKGFTFVVDVSAGGVLYAEPSMDLTSFVMAELNKNYQENKDKKPEAKKDDAPKKD